MSKASKARVCERTGKEKPARIIGSNRYEITSPYPIGRGCWGAVYEARDKVLGDEVAIKVLEPNETARAQMAHRNIDEARAMRNEAAKLAACGNIVPRVLDIDETGRFFIVMPRYKRNLHSVLSEHYPFGAYEQEIEHPGGLGERRTFKFSTERFNSLMQYSHGVCKSLRDMHVILGRVHGDIKADNYVLDGRNPLLTDLGAATLPSIGRSVSPRDNIGNIFTRAPECFAEGSHPDRRSDVYSGTALIYSMIEGGALFGKELWYIKDRAEFMRGLDRKKAQGIIDGRVDDAPRVVRDFLRRGLRVDPSKRYESGEEMLESFEKVKRRYEGDNSVRPYLKAVAIVGLCGVLTAGLHTCAKNMPEPKEIKIPGVVMRGPIFIHDSNDDGAVRYVKEDGLDLPKVDLRHCTVGPDYDYVIKCSTMNRNVAWLMKNYMRAVSGGGTPYNESQFRMWTAYTLPEERNAMSFPAPHFKAIAKSIEVGLSKAKLEDRTVDLEDACAIARVGEDLVSRAKRASNSFDFKSYIGAKDPKGQYIVPEKEQEFIRSWLAYVVND